MTGWAPRWGLVTRKNRPWLEAWCFQPCLPFLWEGSRAENGINDQSCLHDEAFMKFPEYGVQRVSRLVSTGKCGRVVWKPLDRAWSSIPLYIPVHLFHLAWVVSFYSKLDPVSKMFLWVLWGAITNYLNPRRMFLETPIYRQLVRNTEDNLGLQLAPQARSEGGRLSALTGLSP